MTHSERTSFPADSIPSDPRGLGGRGHREDAETYPPITDRAADGGGRLRKVPGMPAAASAGDLIRAMVEQVVVPKLIGGQDQMDPYGGGRESSPVSGHGDRLADIACAGSAHDALDYLSGLQARGLTFDSILRDAVAPAATRLGDMWTQDRLTFVDVTLAAGRLTQAVHVMSAQSDAPDLSAPVATRVLVGVVPGEQHRMGIAIVEELLRRDGCEVVAVAGMGADDLTEAVGAAHYDAVALSVSCDSRLKGLPATIRALRRASCNPALHVLVGGPAIGGDVGVARKIGADATALDGWQAVLHMRLLKRSVALQRTRTIQETGPERDLPNIQG